jgi:hypothetical protein
MTGSASILIQKLTVAGRICFLLIYVIYGISPLCYTVDLDACDMGSYAESVDDQLIPEIFAISIVADTLTGDDTPPREEQGFRSGDNEETVMARKRRAVASNRRDLDRKDDVLSISDEHADNHAIPSADTDTTNTHLCRSHDGYYFVNSGLSPPLS